MDGDSLVDDSDGGDVWGSDDATSEAEFERSMLAREQRKLQSAHRNAGLLEGIEHGKERSLQHGFDQAFLRSSRSLFGVHMLLGALSTLEQYLDKAPQPSDDTKSQDIHALQSELETFTRQIHQHLDSIRQQQQQQQQEEGSCNNGGGCCKGNNANAIETAECGACGPPSTTPNPVTAESDTDLEGRQARYRARVLELLRSVWPDATL